jgi:hypothetical protein
MSASFYASPTIGATTTVAVFFHEIPHEVGDFALLVQSGFSKRAAMGAQFITAVGALLGTLIGIAVQELGGKGGGEGNGHMAKDGGLWGTSLVSFVFYSLCVSCLPRFPFLLGVPAFVSSLGRNVYASLSFLRCVWSLQAQAERVRPVAGLRLVPRTRLLTRESSPE